MTTAYRDRTVLGCSALTGAALVLPFAIPASATLLGWALEVPMRLALTESLLATLGVFAAWLVVSLFVDVILEDSDIGGTLAGRLVSAGTSLVLLGGGYFLIVGSPFASALMAAMVCGLLFVLSSRLERSHRVSR